MINVVDEAAPSAKCSAKAKGKPKKFMSKSKPWSCPGARAADSYLVKLVKSFYKTLDTDMRRNVTEVIGVLKLCEDQLMIGSACSGSELHRKIGEIVMRTITQDSIDYVTLFACENDHRKQKWIREVANTEKSEGSCKPHLFADLKDLHRNIACCVEHSGCTVPASCRVPTGDCGPHIL